MADSHEIKYDKFTADVYTPDGVFIKKASVNLVHQFYCSGLVPGTEYLLVFCYEDILLTCLSFICNSAGQVVYLSPAHFIFNNQVSALSPKAGNELATKVKRRAEYNVPFMRWESVLLEKFISEQKGKYTPCSMKSFRPRFKAGAQLAKAVK